MGYFSQRAKDKAEARWGVSFGDPKEDERHQRMMRSIRRIQEEQKPTVVAKPRFLTNTHYWRQRAWEEGATS